MGKMCCGKAAEGHGCGCGTKEMNWESYDKPSFTKTMMAENSNIPMVISIDTSFSTSMKFKVKTQLTHTGHVFEQDTLNAQYRKTAIAAIYNLSPSEVTIFDHNGTVEQVFAGNEYAAVQFIRNKDNLQPRNGTAKMSAVIKAVMRLRGNKLILTDADNFSHENPKKAENSKMVSCERCGSDFEDTGFGEFGTNCGDCGDLICFECGNFDSDSGNCLDCVGYESFEAEPVVQEPDWIPAGDGRAIGQQDFAINLSPLHAETLQPNVHFDPTGVSDEQWGEQIIGYGVDVTIDEFSHVMTPELEKRINDLGERLLNAESFNAESRFDKLSNEIADEYEEKGMSPEKAQEVGDATAAKIGRAKYGKKGMRNMQKKGMKADMVGSPSPTFNEDITGQDGPSADPTNQTFEAMMTLAPSSTDVNRARRDLKNSGYGDVIYDRYMVYRDGSSNKFYYTAVTEKDGKYYPMGAYGRIGYLSKLFNIYGKTENPRASLSTMDSAYRQCSGKEKAKIKKGYVDYTLQMAESFESETLAQIEGPTAEATTGGLHAPSSFAMTWEDGTGQSSASIPPNEIAWAENVKAGEGKIFGIGIGTLAVAALGIFGVKKLMDKKSDTASVDDTKKAEKCCGGSKIVAKSETVTKHSEYSADRINPVEVEGQNDIRNAESISLPQPNMGPQTAHRQSNRPSLNLW